jgi:hypothetical protein
MQWVTTMDGWHLSHLAIEVRFAAWSAPLDWYSRSLRVNVAAAARARYQSAMEVGGGRRHFRRGSISNPQRARPQPPPRRSPEPAHR